MILSFEGHRRPSIHFLGHDGWAARLKGETKTSAPVKNQVTTEGTGVEGSFVFTSISEQEMDAIQLGFTEEFL